MNARAILYSALTGDAQLTAIVPTERIYAAGSLEGSPARPWIVIRTGDESSRLRDDRSSVASQLRASVWVYDEPGSYLRIDAILTHVRRVLLAMPGDASAICCEWAGDGPELGDDELKAILRVGNFTLIGVS